MWIDQSYAIVTKGVFTKILVHSDVSFDSITISPTLPSVLVVDIVTRTIMGMYNGTYTGRSCYTVTVHNSLGSCADTICLFYTGTSSNLLLPRFCNQWFALSNSRCRKLHYYIQNWNYFGRNSLKQRNDVSSLHGHELFEYSYFNHAPKLSLHE